MELKISCSSCKYATLKPPFYVYNEKGEVIYENKNDRSSENTIFVCNLYPKERDVHRKHSCSHYKFDPQKVNTFNSIDYCSECDADTYSKERFCSRCWCDRDDSELFNEEFN